MRERGAGAMLTDRLLSFMTRTVDPALVTRFRKVVRLSPCLEEPYNSRQSRRDMDSGRALTTWAVQ